jgi:hypothetical protein
MSTISCSPYRVQEARQLQVWRHNSRLGQVVAHAQEIMPEVPATAASPSPARRTS